MPWWGSNLVSPGLRKGHLFLGLELEGKNPLLQPLVLVSLAISSTHLHRCAEPQTQKGRNWPKVTPSPGQGPGFLASRVLLLHFCIGDVHFRDRIALWWW